MLYIQCYIQCYTLKTAWANAWDGVNTGMYMRLQGSRSLGHSVDLDNFNLGTFDYEGLV